MKFAASALCTYLYLLYTPLKQYIQENNASNVFIFAVVKTKAERFLGSPAFVALLLHAVILRCGG
jgi:hypothetical protein